MALLILALLVAHFRLSSFWNQLAFVAFGLFMMILKNGIRIASFTLLVVYDNPDFLFGRLHHQGSVVFFVLALLLLLPLLFFLERIEAKRDVPADLPQFPKKNYFAGEATTWPNKRPQMRRPRHDLVTI